MIAQTRFTERAQRISIQLTRNHLQKEVQQIHSNKYRERNIRIKSYPIYYVKQSQTPQHPQEKNNFRHIRDYQRAYL